MANRVTPTRIDADNSAGSPVAACNDWRIAGRFHVGTGHNEPTQDAGYTTAGDFPENANLSVSFLAFRGRWYGRLLRPVMVQVYYRALEAMAIAVCQTETFV